MLRITRIARITRMPPPVPNPRYVLCPTCAVLIRDSDRFGRKCLLQNRLKKILGLCAGMPNFNFELTA